MDRQVPFVLVLVGLCHIAVATPFGGPNQYVLNHGVELSELEQQIPVAKGLAWGYYAGSCPTAESIVSARVAASLKSDGGVAAGLVRLVFHDCFVQGCDASILLNTAKGSELNTVPNQTIRQSALQLIADIKSRIEAACPKTVSCADIVVLAAKVAVAQAGGPSFNVPLGRLDSLAFSASVSDLPGPQTTFQQQSAIFTRKGLDTNDLVALAGGHTLGVAHCGTFNSRLFPTVDPKLNPNYASYLKTNVCPTLSNTNSTGLDFYSPNKFDNQYFKNLPTGGALMPSDQNLDQDPTAWKLVNQWASNQNAFFQQFAWSFTKMSQIQIITSTSKGEIRKVCSTTNSGQVSIVDPENVLESILESEDSDSNESEDGSFEPEVIAMVVDGRADA